VRLLVHSLRPFGVLCSIASAIHLSLSLELRAALYSRNSSESLENKQHLFILRI
jgi:hypothetical protein